MFALGDARIVLTSPCMPFRTGFVQMQRIQNGATAGNVVADEYIADISSENALGTMDHDGPCSQLDVEDNVGTNMMNSDDDDSDDDDGVDDYDEFAPFCPIDPPHQEHSPNGGEGADSAAQTLVQPLAREELEAGEDSANNFLAALSASTTQTAAAVPEPTVAGTTSNLALATFTSTTSAQSTLFQSPLLQSSLPQTLPLQSRQPPMPA